MYSNNHKVTALHRAGNHVYSLMNLVKPRLGAGKALRKVPVLRQHSGLDATTRRMPWRHHTVQVFLIT